MKKIVEMVLKEEEEARARIEKARQEASLIVMTAKKESQDIIDAAITEAKDLAEKQREEFQRQLLSEKEKNLKTTREEVTILRNSRQKDIQAVARKVFLKVIEIEG